MAALEPATFVPTDTGPNQLSREFNQVQFIEVPSNDQLSLFF